MKEVLQTQHPCYPEEGLLTTISQSWYAQGGLSGPPKASGPCCCLAGLWLGSCSICCYLGQSSCWCCCQQLPLSTWDSCATQGSIQPRGLGAERCSRTAALQRSWCWDSCPCRRFWCSPRPPAPSCSGDCALHCLLPRGAPNRREAEKRLRRATALTKRSSSVPGSEAGVQSPAEGSGGLRAPSAVPEVARRWQPGPLDQAGASEKVPWLCPHEVSALRPLLCSAASFAGICGPQTVLE